MKTRNSFFNSFLVFCVLILIIIATILGYINFDYNNLLLHTLGLANPSEGVNIQDIYNSINFMDREGEVTQLLDDLDNATTGDKAQQLADKAKEIEESIANKYEEELGRDHRSKVEDISTDSSLTEAEKQQKLSEANKDYTSKLSENQRIIDRNLNNINERFDI